MHRRRPLVAVLLAPLLLAGCTSTAAPPHPVLHVHVVEEYPGFDEHPTGGPPHPSTATPAIRWLGTGRTRVALTMSGSAGCPPVPTGMRIVSPVAVTLTMKTYRGVCTTDTGPRTSEFAVPGVLSRTRPVVFTMTTSDPEPDQEAVLTQNPRRTAPTS